MKQPAQTDTSTAHPRVQPGNSMTRMVSDTPTCGVVPEWPQLPSSATTRRLDREMLLTAWSVCPDSELQEHSCYRTGHALQCGVKLWTNPTEQPRFTLSLQTVGLTTMLLNLFSVAKINCFASLSWKFLSALLGKKKPNPTIKPKIFHPEYPEQK